MATDDDIDAEDLRIDCDTHGPKQIAAVVCRHMVTSSSPVGFVENNDDPNDMQAWCDDCERMYLEEGAMTERFVAFNNFGLVCVGCYATIKQLHSR